MDTHRCPDLGHTGVNRPRRRPGIQQPHPGAGALPMPRPLPAKVADTRQATIVLTITDTALATITAILADPPHRPRHRHQPEHPPQTCHTPLEAGEPRGS